MAQPTVFQLLVDERRWRDYDVFKHHYEEAAAELAQREGPPNLRTATIGRRQFVRWLRGQLESTPRNDAKRILEHLFQVPVSHLFQPAQHGSEQACPGETGRQATALQSGFYQSGMEDAVSMAAHESARFAARVEQSNVGPHTLEQLRVDIQRIIYTYPNRPVMPLFLEVRELRNRAFELLEGRQPPQYTKELYLAAGTLCGILANASFDLGQYGPAGTQARTAFLCGELAGHNGLRSWVRGMQALIAYWDERPEDAVRLALSGQEFTPEEGTAHIRLASISARALARLGRHEEALSHLQTAERHRQSYAGPEDHGNMMAFPGAKQSLYASTTHLWIGTDHACVSAEREAAAAIDTYEAAPPEQRRLGELSLARMDLAHARLQQREIDGAAEQLQIVLAMEARRRTASVGRRLEQFGRRLALTPAARTPLGLAMYDSIAAYHEQHARSLPGGSAQ